MPNRTQGTGRVAKLVSIGISPDAHAWNPDRTFTWSNGELTQVDETQAGVTVRQTLSWTNGELQSTSSWAEI